MVRGKPRGQDPIEMIVEVEVVIIFGRANPILLNENSLRSRARSRFSAVDVPCQSSTLRAVFGHHQSADLTFFPPSHRPSCDENP
jgi:hypothetical protein